MATKGRDQQSTIVAPPSTQEVTLRGRKLKRGIQLWPVGVSVAKHELYGWLSQPPPLNPGDPVPRGYCHFPMHGEGWFQGLTAEELRKKTVKGFVKYFWEKVRQRNEPLDCRVLARAALAALGADRWSDEQWKERAGRAASPTLAAPAPQPRARAAAPGAATPQPTTTPIIKRRSGGWL
jgi:phage terminase large subunit GpA-like protein